MKIKTDECELVVPKIIVGEWEKDKGFSSDETEDFCNWWKEIGKQLIYPEPDKLVDKEIAEFIVSMSVDFREGRGGYPIEQWFEFENNGYKYSICTYDWNWEGYGLRTVGYKEKIIKKEMIKNESPN